MNEIQECPFDPMPYGQCGMMHCPECGYMIMGGMPHFKMADLIEIQGDLHRGGPEETKDEIEPEPAD